MHANSVSRRNEILGRLFRYKKISYQCLSEEFYVSRSSIANDLAFIKKVFKKNGVELVFDNSGTFYNGSEIALQQVIKSVVMSQFGDGSTYYCVNQLELIQEYLVKFATERLEYIDQNVIYNISLSIAIMLFRRKQGFEIEKINRFTLHTLKTPNQLPLALEVIAALEKSEELNFTLSEKAYISTLTIGGNLKFQSDCDLIPNTFQNEIDFFIKKCSSSLLIDLSTDERLKRDLTHHLFQLSVRLKNNTRLINPLVDELRESYPIIFNLIKFELADFFPFSKFLLTDDEITLILIHVQAAIERSKKHKKILFLCPNGIGVSSYLFSKITAYLPKTANVVTISLRELTDIDLEMISFIISTVPIVESLVPIVQISPLIQKDELRKILNLYLDLTFDFDNLSMSQDQEKRILSNLSDCIYFRDFKNKQEVLEFLLDKSRKSILNIEAYKDSIIQREQLQSIYLGNGFCIPHGNPRLIKDSAISILVLDHPIPWGEEKVDIVCLLAVTSEDSKKVGEIMRMIVDGIENKEAFISKMMEAQNG